MIKRRSFIGWGIFGVFLAKIFKPKSAIFAQTDSSAQFYLVGTVEELETQGFLLNEDLEIGEVLVTQTQEDCLLAVNPTCTHAGCLVEWQKTENMFICPCHQSKFQQDGTLIEGLAITDLDKYQVKVENNVVFVTE